MNDTDAFQLLVDDMRLQNNKDGVFILTRPEYRYLTAEQANKWIAIGAKSNVHTESRELSLIDGLSNKLMSTIRSKNIILVDLGCGDGRKAVDVISKFSAKGSVVRKYVAIDVNAKLIEKAVSSVIEWCNLPASCCIKANSLFQDPQLVRNMIRDKSSDERVFIFLGNTLNNFSLIESVDLVNAILEPTDYIFVGAKCRTPAISSQELVAQYSTYGSDFTFSFGRLLGYHDNQMKRVVLYNPLLGRLEVKIEVSSASSQLRAAGINNVQSLLVLVSYRPQKSDVLIALGASFEIISYLDAVDDLVVLGKKL